MDIVLMDLIRGKILLIRAPEWLESQNVIPHKG
jgi:hypothetical protein